MTARTPGTPGTPGKSGPDPLSDAMDRLYGAPFDQFVPMRKELALALRAAGELPASRLVGAAAKPTRNAWALNQIARNHPDLLRALFDAREAAATAQTRGDAEQVRSGVREYRERLADVVRAARDALARTGAILGPTQSRRIGESLQAMSAGDDAMRAKLVAGRLTNDVETEDPFAGLEMAPPRANSRPQPRPQERRQQEDGAARKREASAKAASEREARSQREQRERAIQRARQRVQELETKARDARTEARKLEVAATHAQSAADRARRAVRDAEGHLEASRRELERLNK
jgi:hypothetical protein